MAIREDGRGAVPYSPIKTQDRNRGFGLYQQTQSLVPFASDLYTLGIASQQWEDLWVNDAVFETVSANAVAVAVHGDWNPSASNQRDLGSAGARWEDAYIDDIFIVSLNPSSSNISVQGDLIPSSSHLYDLGDSSNAFEDAYVDDVFILTLNPQGGAGNTITMYGDMDPDTSNVRNLGNATDYYADTYTDILNARLITGLTTNLILSGDIDIVGGYIYMQEISAPSAPGSNTGRIYMEDNGSGKTRLMVIFNSGAAQQIAIQP